VLACDVAHTAPAAANGSTSAIVQSHLLRFIDLPFQ
jgi:hypothetical protein